MFHVLLDPYSLAKVLDGMVVHSSQMLHPMRVTIARHPKLGICTLVETTADLDTVVISERCVLACAAVGDNGAESVDRPDDRYTPVHVVRS